MADNKIFSISLTDGYDDWYDKIKSPIDLSRLTEKKLRPVAEYALKRMQKSISKSGEYKIGASNTSSENLFIRGVRTDQSSFAWEIYEGDNSQAANWYIRGGIGKRAYPDIKDLRLWAARKGLSLGKTQSTDDRNRDKMSFIQSSSKRGKIYGRSKSRKDEANAALYRIRSALYAQGTNRAGSWWMQKTGKSYFDYIRFVLKSTHSFQAQMRNASDKLGGAVASYLGRRGTGASSMYITTGGQK